MKTKLTLMAIAVTLAAAFQAKAIVIPSITNYSRLNITLTVKTNLPLEAVSDGYRYAFKTTKIDNKALLALFQGSQFANTTFPDGSFLAMGWQGAVWGHVVVMDKNGTNVLYDASANYFGAGTNYLFITWNGVNGGTNAGFGALVGLSDTTNPGGTSWIQFNCAYFELDDSAGGTFLYANGPSTEHWKSLRDINGAYTVWSASESFAPHGAGSKEHLNNSVGDVTVDGEITAAGHGLGSNPIDY